MNNANEAHFDGSKTLARIRNLEENLNFVLAEIFNRRKRIHVILKSKVECLNIFALKYSSLLVSKMISRFYGTNN